MNGKVTLKEMHSISNDTTPETLRDMYDRWADNYDAELSKDYSYLTPVRAAKALAEEVADRSVSILDIACGTGLSGVEAAEQGFTAIDGCDLSPGMLAKAKATGVYQRLFPVNLYEPPIDARDAQYDVALVVGAFAVGHLTPDVLPEILRVIKPGGALVLTVNDMTDTDGQYLGQPLRSLEEQGVLTVVKVEHGEQIPERNVGAWIFVCRKS